MRFTSTSSRYSYYLCAGLAWCLPTLALGYTLSGDGCFERDPGLIRLTEPTCTLTLTTDTTETVQFNFENVDPDSVEVTSADVTLTTERTSTELATSFTLTSAATITVAPWLESGDDLWFVALSDNQAAGTVEANPVFEEMLPLISAINPVFMTNAGDLIQGSSHDDTARDMFTAVLTTLTDTTVPMYPTPGNHDHNSGLGIYESYFGERDYSYDYGPAHFMALSSSGSTSRGTVDSDQLDWLATELAETTKQTIVYFHHPMSVPDWGRTTCCFEDATERNSLAAVLEAGGVDHVINGHSQGYDWRWLTAADVITLQAGVYQLISGGGGGNIAQPDGDFHFVLVHVTPEAITHQVFALSDTDIVVDPNAAGDELTVEYDGAADLPYLRLKFSLPNTPADYLVANSNGDYLPYQQHQFTDHTVVLVDTAITAGTTSTFVATPANSLHAGSNHTIATTGAVTFEALPASTAADTGMQVQPSALTTAITNVAVTDTGFSWTEQPATRFVDTSYQLANLGNGADVQVFVNDQLYDRGRSDTAGTFQFTYSRNVSRREFSVVVTATTLTDIITVPSDQGTAHVRTFSTNGDNTQNFFSANHRIGSFRLGYSYITNETEPALLVTERETGRLFLHASAGEKLDTISISSKVNSTSHRLMVDQGNSIRTYRWSDTKQQLLPVDRWQLPAPLVDWTLVDGDAVAIIKRLSAKRPVRYVVMTNQNIKPLPRNISDVHIVNCRCQTTAADMIMVTWKKNNRRYFSSYTTDLVNVGQKTIRLSQHIDQLITGHLTDQLLDTILIVSDGVAYPLQTKASGKLKRLPAIAGVDQAAIVSDQLVVTTTTRPTQVNVYHYNHLLEEFALNEFFYPYGETFLGGASLAL